jgi:hypothetical protein
MDIVRHFNISLQNDLVQTARDTELSKLIGNSLMDCSVEPIALKSVEDLDGYFVRLNSKDVPNQTNKILENAMTYFNKGHFTSFNNIFGRYIKNMKDLSESEMNNFIVKFVFTSIIKRNIENAISDINTIKQQYIQYDLNIYIL